jgi:uncharacterized phage protein (TIGR02220 family)
LRRGAVAKRFHDTEIWDKPWFMELSPFDKLAFMYIKDKCDAVGVWTPNTKIAEVYIGGQLDWQSLPERCNGNIIILPNKKWWIPDFCEFQYGMPLSESEKNKARAHYVQLLKKHGLWKEYIKNYPKNVSLTKGLEEPSEDSTKGLLDPSESPKEKEKEKEKESGVGTCKNDSIRKRAQKLLEYYKKLTGKSKIKKITSEVTARLNEGHTIEEGEKVILYKFLRWWDDPKMKESVNLTTLFRPYHFEEYLSQAEQGLDQLLQQSYLNFKKQFIEKHMDEPLEVRKKLKLPTFEEFKNHYFEEFELNGGQEARAGPA